MSRYSQLYIDQSAPLSDSARARHRLGKVMESQIRSATELNNYLERELGVKVGVAHSFQWPNFTAKCATRDLLDTITLTFNLQRQDGREARWLAATRRIFAEESMAYEIDDTGIVHPAVDKEFQRNRQAAVAGLQLPRYANSLHAFERVSDALLAQPPNGKEAWRAAFSAVEGLFRLMFPTAPQLNAGAVEAHLAPVMQKVYGSDAVALRAANKQLASFKGWIDASHNYRHEPGSEEPVQPPIDLAIVAISNGASFLRWLIALDQRSAEKP